MSEITEQEARERERAAYVNGRMAGSDTQWIKQCEEEAKNTARHLYPDPVTYGPVITAPGDTNSQRRRRSDGQWETRQYGDWRVSPYVTDTYVLALASCVPVTDAEVEAAVAYLWHVGKDNIRTALTAARAAMRPEGTR